MRLISRLSARRKVSLATLVTGIFLAAVALPLSHVTAATPPTFVQESDVQTIGKTVSQSFASNTTSGNLIVAYVIWDNTGSATVTDSRGDTFTSAGAPTTFSGSYNAQVFYAKNVVGGADTVTATFATATQSFGILYIHEYSGVDTANPLDGSAAAAGGGSAMDSGTVTTTNANDLIFGAGASAGNVTAGGSGFTVRSTAQGNITEDKNVSAVGAYNATATQAGNWAMQVVAFKAAGSVPDTTPPTTPTGLTATAPSSNQVSLNWNASTDDVGVTSYQIFRNGAAIGTVTQPGYTDTSVSPSTSYTYTVTASDAAGNTSPQSASATVTTPAASANGSCPLPAFPNANCTGRPASLGGTYTKDASGKTVVVTSGFANTYTGDYAATTPGQVIDNWHVIGHILIEAANVTVKNSVIEGSITNEIGNNFAGPFTVQDTSIVNGPGSIYTGPTAADLKANPSLAGVGEYCDPEPGIGQTHWTATRVYINHHVTSLQTSRDGNVTVHDSFTKVCGLSPEYTQKPPLVSVDGSHSDTFQAYCPDAPTITCDNVLLDHTTFDGTTSPIVSHDSHGKPYIDSTQYVTAPLFGNQGPSNGYGKNITITNNLAMGGSSTMRYSWAAGPKLIFHNNDLVQGANQYGPVDANNTCANIDWANNSLVTIDAANVFPVSPNTTYKVTSVVGPQACVN